MFGQMNVELFIPLQAGCSDGRSDLDRAVSALLVQTEHPEIARWVHFPAAVPLFLVIPGDPAGRDGAFHIFDRKQRNWFKVDFEDQEYGGYGLVDFEDLVKHSPFLRLIEQPWLLECDGRWLVEPGKPLRCRFEVV